MNGLGRILQIDPEARVITTTAYGEIDLAVQAMKMGAIDFIVKPWNRDQLVNTIKNVLATGKEQKDRCKAINQTILNQLVPIHHAIRKLSASSESMKQVLETIETVAPTDANVLIMGENGTGKELVAWSLHCASLRRQDVFVHVDLGAIPETLFESELFGHARGAFTDAKEERTGRFESASGGTLFLDEIGNLSMPMQAKILTAVQNHEIIKMGTNYPHPINVRLISATNKPLYEMAESFEFRQDLLYRLNTVEIILPPLRERKEDIALLTDYYLSLFSEQYGKHGISIREDTRTKLEKYHWPGNIRELAHAIERAVIMSKDCKLSPEDFVLKIKAEPAVYYDEPIMRVEDYERKAITNALSKNSGNLSKAADDLGVARTTLYRKISRFGIESWK